MNRIALIISLAVIFAAQAFAQQLPDTSSGRYLPGGIWQPRNLHATLPNPYPGLTAQQIAPDSREEIESINWGPDVMLEGPDLMAFYGSVIEGSNGYVHVIVSHAWGMEPFYIRSIDMGQSWQEGHMLWPNGLCAAEYQLFANGSYITLPYSGSGIFNYGYSSDNGDTWEGHTYRQGRAGGYAQHNDTIYVATTQDNHTNKVFFTPDYGISWNDNYLPNMPYAQGVQGLGATNHSFHLLDGVLEMSYSRLNFGENTWSSPIRISRSDGHDSFWGKMTAWGDSNVFAIWVDYEYSPYSWTGDLICRRSTDNGNTWLEEQQVTFNHLALDKNIYLVGDTIYLVYDEIVFDGETNKEEVFFNISTDGGATWGEPERLTYAPYNSVYPSVAVRENRIHVAWCDGRDDTSYSSLYYKRGILSSDGISWDNGDRLPEEESLSAYPNPFNSSTTITIKGLKGGEAILCIYDIQGKLIKTIKGDVMGGEEKKVWDATDATGKSVSSGIYFARVKENNKIQSIKLILLK